MAKLNSNSKKKETEKLLKDKIENLPIRLEERLHFIADDVQKALMQKEEKIMALLNEINAIYPEQSIERGFYDGYSAIVFDTAHSLYLQNNNSALIVELQGILERTCMNAICDTLPINKQAHTIIEDAFEKKTLKDIAPYFVQMEVWNEQDKNFALDLTILRNGIAHKNAEIVSRSKLVASDGQSRHLESIHSMMSKVNCAKFIARTMDLIIKATRLASPSFIKQPRLYARYCEYAALIGELYTLFLTNPFAKGDNPLLETYINKRLARTYIIGSEKLVNLLEIYRDDVLKFHNALTMQDDKRAIELHNRLGNLLKDITNAMRIDLNVDSKNIELPEENILIDIKPYLRKNREKFRKDTLNS